MWRHQLPRLFLPRLFLSSELDWGSYIIYIGKIAFKKTGALIGYMKFLSPEAALYLYKSIIRPCMEYYCHLLGDVLSCYLEMLDKLQKQICRTVCASLAASLEPLGRCRNVASLSYCSCCNVYKCYFGRYLSGLPELLPPPYSTCYSDWLHDFFATIPICYKDVYGNSFLPHTASLWNSLPIEYFPLTYD